MSGIDAPTAERGGGREAAALLCCARTRIDEQTASRLQDLVDRGLDWDGLLQGAGRHCITPLLYLHLNATYPNRVPEAVLAELYARYRANAERNLRLTSELLRLARLLGECGIPAIPWKGPLLAASVYGDLALREFGDLDILVSERDVLKARDLLVACGYEAFEQLSGTQEAAYLRTQHSLNLSRDGGDIDVELHWQIAQRYFAFPVDFAPLWRRARTWAVGGGGVPILSPEDQLLLLCFHGSKHRWERLQWICDISELLRAHADVDWQATMERAEVMGCRRAVLLGVVLADLIGAPVPAPMLRLARSDTSAVSLAAQVWRQLYAGACETPGVFATALFHIRMRERWRDRCRYVLRVVTTPTEKEWKIVSLPPALDALYYPLRPLRLAGKHALRAASRLLKNAPGGSSRRPESR